MFVVFSNHRNLSKSKLQMFFLGPGARALPPNNLLLRLVYPWIFWSHFEAPKTWSLNPPFSMSMKDGVYTPWRLTVEPKKWMFGSWFSFSIWVDFWVPAINLLGVSKLVSKNSRFFDFLDLAQETRLERFFWKETLHSFQLPHIHGVFRCLSSM